MLVTNRGRLIARLAPVSGGRHEEGRRERLPGTGRLKPPKAPLPNGFWKRKRPEDRTGRALAALFAERESGW